MSIILDRLIVQSATMYPATVALSPESVTVLLFASAFLENPDNWLDTQEDPLDEITAADWDQIEKLVGNTYEEIMNPILGYIFPLVTADIPDNCLECDGATYDRVDFPALYDKLDAVFRINADTFFVPDLRSRVPIGAGTGTGLSTYAVNAAGGEETHALTDAENGTHSHSIGGATTGLAVAPGELPVLVPSVIAGATGSSGLGTGHNNLQPYVALRFAMVAQ